AYRRLAEAPERRRVTVLFPTLVFGGGEDRPTSHLTGGLDGIVRYLWALRWFTLDGSLHFVHAADIARVVAHLLDHPAPGEDFVLGNAAHTVDEVLDAFCEYYALPRSRALNLTPLAGLIQAIAGSKMNSWDRYCLKQRHFRYQCVNPRHFGLPAGYERLVDILYERDPRALRGYPAPEPAT
ncbi:MAG TPA: NAD(P)-dependent oxidoreductase, partial [Oscillatoriaceae cyanobacterium]